MKLWGGSPDILFRLQGWERMLMLHPECEPEGHKHSGLSKHMLFVVLNNSVWDVFEKQHHLWRQSWFYQLCWNVKLLVNSQNRLYPRVGASLSSHFLLAFFPLSVCPASGQWLYFCVLRLEYDWGRLDRQSLPGVWAKVREMNIKERQRIQVFILLWIASRLHRGVRALWANWLLSASFVWTSTLPFSGWTICLRSLRLMTISACS